MEYKYDGIIPGFKFVPNDQDIIVHYLRPKVNGAPLPWDGIKEFDVYGDTGRGPWELVHPNQQPVYSFTMSINKSRERKVRTFCDFGTWNYRRDVGIFDEGDRSLIGLKALLTFEPKKSHSFYSEANLGGHWNMHEYSLPDSKKDDCFVVCKVSFKFRKGADRTVEELLNSAGVSYCNENYVESSADPFCNKNNNTETTEDVSLYLNNDEPSLSGTAPTYNNAIQDAPGKVQPANEDDRKVRRLFH